MYYCQLDVCYTFFFQKKYKNELANTSQARIRKRYVRRLPCLINIILRMTKQDTIYRFNADSFIKENEPGKSFYERVSTATDHLEKVEWRPVIIGTVWITEGPKEYQIHIPVTGDFENYTLDLPITAEHYKKFQQYKGDKRRLNLVAKVSKGKLKFRNLNKTEMLVVRMNPFQMELFSRDADLCGMTVSEYARQLLEGKKPRAAFTKEETVKIEQLVKLRSDMLKFYNATKGELAKIPREQRTAFIVLGMPYAHFRDYIRAALIMLDKMIGDEYNAQKMFEFYESNHKKGGEK